MLSPGAAAKERPQTEHRDARKRDRRCCALGRAQERRCLLLRRNSGCADLSKLLRTVVRNCCLICGVCRLRRPCGLLLSAAPRCALRLGCVQRLLRMSASMRPQAGCERLPAAGKRPTAAPAVTVHLQHDCQLCAGLLLCLTERDA